MIRAFLLWAILFLCAASCPAAAVAVVPTDLGGRLQAIARSFDGQAGLAVRDLRTGRRLAVRGAQRFPQRSVFKLWVAVALLDARNRGVLRLDEPILIRRSDRSVFVQPLAEKVGPGGYLTTLDELLGYMVVHSDNLAADLLIRRLGGPATIQAAMNRKGLRGIRVDRTERDLQAEISGLRWRDAFVEPTAFDAARAALPAAARLAARDAYLADPRDTATPRGTVNGLAAQSSGRLLSRASTEKLLGLMASTLPGAKRLKAGLPAGWRLAHRPGTAGGFGGINLATNDVGVVTAPNGRAYAVAVFLKGGRGSLEAREILIAAVAEAVVDQWTAAGKTAATAGHDRDHHH